MYISGPSAGRFEMRVTDASNNVLKYFQDQLNTVWNRGTYNFNYFFTASGSTTMKIRIGTADAGTYTIDTAAGYGLFWSIEDIGAA